MLNDATQTDSQRIRTNDRRLFLSTMWTQVDSDISIIIPNLKPSFDKSVCVYVWMSAKKNDQEREKNI